MAGFPPVVVCWLEMPKLRKQTPYLSWGGLARLAVIAGLVYSVYAFGAASSAIGSGWAAAMKLQGKAPDCPWTKIARYYPNLDLFANTYKAQLDQIEVLERDPALPIERVKTAHGELWTRTTAEGTEVGYILAEHDWLEKLVPEELVRPGDVVIDVGGHVGLFTRKALDRGAAKVVAIEPDPNSVECLRRNFAAEIAEGRVVIVPAGAWYEEGTMQLSLSAAPGRNSLVEDMSERTIDVPVRKLDDIVAELSLEKVSFIKMDIEGAEPQALQGAQGVLRRFHPTVMIDAYTWPGDLGPIDELLESADKTYERACGPCEATADFTMIMPHVIFYNTPAGRL
jgi:FkbM family methyltransferase